MISGAELKRHLLLGLALSAFLVGCTEFQSLSVHLPMLGGRLGDFLVAGDAEWERSEGSIKVIRGEERGYIYTKALYSDFEFSMNFFIEADTNSGVYTHCLDSASITPQSCFEFNIWDANTNPDNRTGAIIGIAPPLTQVTTAGKWNSIRIRSVDGHHQVWVNDILTGDVQNDSHKLGHIALQYGGSNGMVEFTDIEIRSL